MAYIKNWFAFQYRLLLRYRERKRWAVFLLVLCTVILLCGATGNARLEDYIDMDIVKNTDYYYSDDMREAMGADNFSQLPVDIMAGINKDYFSEMDTDAMQRYDVETAEEITEELLAYLKD